MEPSSRCFERNTKQGHPADLVVLGWLMIRAPVEHHHMRVIAVDIDVAKLQIPLFALANTSPESELDAQAIRFFDVDAQLDLLLLACV